MATKGNNPRKIQPAKRCSAIRITAGGKIEEIKVPAQGSKIAGRTITVIISRN